MERKTLFFSLISIVTIIGLVASYFSFFNTSMNQSSTTQTSTTTVVLNTNKGAITLELYPELVPNTVKNFTDLAQKGFYDGIRFHRVIPGFMIQSGDPLSKDVSQKERWGTGGRDNFTFKDEFHPTLSNVTGTISMANRGPHTNDTQWFINTADNTFLDNKHAVFGKVVSGMDIAMAIAQEERDQYDRPIANNYDGIVIETIQVQ